MPASPRLDASGCRCSRSAERTTFLMRASAAAAAVAGRAGSSCRPTLISIPPAEVELATLEQVNAPADARLACQAHLLGRPVSVRRVYPAFVDAEAASEPDSWPAETAAALESMP